MVYLAPYDDICFWWKRLLHILSMVVGYTNYSKDAQTHTSGMCYYTFVYFCWCKPVKMYIRFSTELVQWAADLQDSENVFSESLGTWLSKEKSCIIILPFFMSCTQTRTIPSHRRCCTEWISVCASLCMCATWLISVKKSALSVDAASASGENKTIWAFLIEKPLMSAKCFCAPAKSQSLTDPSQSVCVGKKTCFLPEACSEERRVGLKDDVFTKVQCNPTCTNHQTSQNDWYCSWPRSVV